MSPGQAVIFLTWVLLLILFIFVGPIIGRRVDLFFRSISDQLHVLIDDPQHLVRFGPMLFWTLLGVIPRLLKAGGSRKPSWLLITNVLFWTSFSLYPLHDPAVAELLLWKIVSAGWLGLSVITLGLYEHISVVVLLPKRPREQTEL